MDAILDLSRTALWQGDGQALETVCSPALASRDAKDYDVFISRAKAGHYSQSREWAKVVCATKPVTPYYFLARKGGRVIGAAMVLRGRIGPMPLPIAQVERGPVCDKISDLPAVLTALRQVTLGLGIARLSVMPYWSQEPHIVDSFLEHNGFADHQSFATRHARSLRVDLEALSEADPFAAAGLAKVRQAVRRAERAGATARLATREDFVHFRRLNEELLQHQGAKHLPSPGWYEALAAYFGSGKPYGAGFISEFEGKPVAMVLITNHGGIATYALGASTAQNFKFPKMMLPLSHALIWAKNSGAAKFDLGGIPLPGDPDPKRASIAEFKYAFSHTEISLVREHVRWF